MTKRAVSVLPPVVAQPSAGPARRGWLLLAHQLPATPSKLRVKTWRRLQDIGAIAVKQALYVLPDTPEGREDFEWLRVEIEGSGGEAVVFSANHLDVEAERALVEEFRRSRQSAYSELAAELQRVQAKGGTRRGQPHPREVARFRQRFHAIERIDFFGSAGRDRAAALLAAIESKRAGPSHHGATAGGGDAPSYRGRLWVTRPRPGVDRMSSAWLIRNFIDPAATFAFATDAKQAPEHAIPFDMYGAGFGHSGDRCTFETLIAAFGIDDRAVSRLAEVVHDLDLKDGKFGAPEAPTLGAAIDGLRLSCADDHQLLERGTILFEAMHRSFSQDTAPPRPRALAKAPASRRRRKK